ncbi:hypothetical protein AAKU55_001549 [Oxalobacteraceae bacterium GrIS 1.11]
MKKLLGIAALIFAFSPFAQAQNGASGLAGHPDARNNRQSESNEAMPQHKHAEAKHMRGHHAKPHHKPHHKAHHAK